MFHLFGFRAERMAAEWPGSLLLVRKHRPVEELDRPPRAGQPRPTPELAHA